MKKIFRRALSLTIASGLTLAMAVTAGAAEGDTLTRGEMAKLLVEGAGLTDQVAQYQSQASVFSDVAEDSEYKGYINLAYAQGLISGTGADTFSPDAQTTQVEAAAAIMQYAGVPEEMLTSWPSDYSTTAARVGLTDGITYSADAAVTEGQFQTMLENGSSLVGKPYIGITWKANDQDYAGFKAVIEAAGGNPVELYQVTSTAVGYGADGMIQSAYVEDTGNLLQEYADQIKARNYSATNVAEVMEGIDGVFFTGGEDISPSLFAVPQEEANGGEEINATRDISDYTLMAYCIDNDVPTLAACRGMQMMSIVSGADFIQEIPDYYAEQGAEYNDLHRMPAGTPNRDYARHSVEIIDKESWLYDIVNADTLDNVSSWHHQAVRSVEGTDLTVVAQTVDNGVTIIEGVENQNNTFCLGVQFHPENDCKLAVYDKNPEAALCDVDTCMTFFETLVGYAADKTVIGISWGGDPVDYTDIQDIIRDAGGVVTHLPQITSYDQAVDALAQVDGIVVTGGEDINPALYNEEASPLLEDNTEYRDIRDTSDYNLIKAAVDTDEPMLDICRGMQMLNVVCGGGLIQDLNTYMNTPDSTAHRAAPDWARHSITVTDTDSLLYDIVGGTTLDNVASWHHQAANPDRVGDGLTVVSSAADGVIEALEYQDNHFALGVQFHPEADALTSDAFMAFFEALLEAAA